MWWRCCMLPSIISHYRVQCFAICFLCRTFQSFKVVLGQTPDSVKNAGQKTCCQQVQIQRRMWGRKQDTHVCPHWSQAIPSVSVALSPSRQMTHSSCCFTPSRERACMGGWMWALCGCWYVGTEVSMIHYIPRLVQAWRNQKHAKHIYKGVLLEGLLFGPHRPLSNNIPYTLNIQIHPLKNNIHV